MLRGEEMGTVGAQALQFGVLEQILPSSIDVV